MTDKSTILKGRAKYEEYVNIRETLWEQGYSPNEPDPDVPFLEYLVSELAKLGFDSMETFNKENTELLRTEYAQKLLSLSKPGTAKIGLLDISTVDTIAKERSIQDLILSMRQRDVCEDTVFFINPPWVEPRCSASGMNYDDNKARLESLGVELCRYYRGSGGPVIWNHNYVSMPFITKGRFSSPKESRECWDGVALRTLIKLGIGESRLGIPPGTNNIRVGKRKVGGTSGQEQGDTYLSSCGFYLDCDYDTASVIFADEALKEHVTTLVEELQRPVTAGEVKAALVDACKETFSVQPLEQTLAEYENKGVS